MISIVDAKRKYEAAQQKAIRRGQRTIVLRGWTIKLIQMHAIVQHEHERRGRNGGLCLFVVLVAATFAVGFSLDGTYEGNWVWPAGIAGIAFLFFLYNAKKWGQLTKLEREYGSDLEKGTNHHLSDIIQRGDYDTEEVTIVELADLDPLYQFHKRAERGELS